jgi:hypothetical protein
VFSEMLARVPGAVAVLIDLLAALNGDGVAFAEDLEDGDICLVEYNAHPSPRTT